MAYDTVRRRTVLSKGFFGSGTWEWDGQTWMQIKPPTSPPTRDCLAMAYDSARHRTMLFGGGGPQPFDDTWEWNGKTWKEVTVSASPPARDTHAMVYDSARQRTVLFGGGCGRPFCAAKDTWEWDGKMWTQINPSVSPGHRRFHAMAYDSARQRTVLFGGGFSSPQDDTWEYGIPNLTLAANPPTISIASGGTQTLSINAGADLKNNAYWVFGSATSTMPGIVLSGIHIPLVPDVYTDIAISAANSTAFSMFMGTLSATGTATATLSVPANLRIPTGFRFYHSYVVYDGTTGQIFTSSNPVSVELR